MASQIGFVDNSVKLASHAFLDTIVTLATANGWTILEDARTGDTPSVIVKGPGNLDYQDVYVGLRCYHNVLSDYYNIELAGFNGYVAGAAWESQPQPLDGSGQRVTVSSPLHNTRIDYWLVVNDLRIAFGAKIAASFYSHAYAGLALSYQAPGQNTYPFALGGCWRGQQPARYSDVEPFTSDWDQDAFHMPYKGDTQNSWFRTADNVWVMPEVYPWNNPYVTGTTVLRDTDGNYPIKSAVLNHPTLGLIGEYDGIFYIPGFNNSSENTLVIDTKNYVVLQALNQVGLSDYIAMRLD